MDWIMSPINAIKNLNRYVFWIIIIISFLLISRFASGLGSFWFLSAIALLVIRYGLGRGIKYAFIGIFSLFILVWLFFVIDSLAYPTKDVFMKSNPTIFYNSTTSNIEIYRGKELMPFKAKTTKYDDWLQVNDSFHKYHKEFDGSWVRKSDVYLSDTDKVFVTKMIQILQNEFKKTKKSETRITILEDSLEFCRRNEEVRVVVESHLMALMELEKKKIEIEKVYLEKQKLRDEQRKESRQLRQLILEGVSSKYIGFRGLHSLLGEPDRMDENLWSNVGGQAIWTVKGNTIDAIFDNDGSIFVVRYNGDILLAFN